MKEVKIVKLSAILIGVLFLISLLLTGAAAAMEIELAEYRPPSADILGPGESDLFGIDAEPAAETAVPFVPETVSGDLVPSIDYVSLWTGEWILAEDPESFLSIMPGEDGKLHMLAMFNQMIGVEADFTPLDGRVIIFSSEEFGGSLVRSGNDSVIMTIGNGIGMQPDEPFYEFFLNKPFVFTRDGQPDMTADVIKYHWASELLISDQEYSSTSQTDEKFPVWETLSFDRYGKLSSWYSSESTEYGHRGFSWGYSSVYVYDYDKSGHEIREAYYSNGVIENETENAYDNDGKQVLSHKAVYSDREVRHNYRYYEYDADKRLIRIRLAEEVGGQSAVEKAYEYAEDGSYKETSYIVKRNYDVYAGMVTWYDSNKRETRRVYYDEDGTVYQEENYEYKLNGDGNVIRETQKINYEYVHDKGTYTIITEYSYDENGKQSSKRQWTEGQPGVVTHVWVRDENNHVIYEYDITEYEDGKVGFSNITEYDLSPTNGRTLCTRSYSDSEYFGREAQEIGFTLLEGDRGTKMGISPLPAAKGEATYSFSMDTLKNNIRNMTREAITRSPSIHQVSSCFYDSDVAFDFYGYNGGIRFAFSGEMSNRLGSVWWVCRDDSVSGEEIHTLLEMNGVDWNNGFTKGTGNMLGIKTEEGYFEDGWVTLAEVSYNNEKLVYLCFRFTWSGPEEGFVQPWEMNPSDFRTSDVQPVDETIIESIEDSVDESSDEGTEETAEAPVSDELPDYSTLLSNGDLLFDYGLVAFESPGDTEPMVAKMNEDGVSSFIRAPYQDEYRDILQKVFPEASEEELRERTLTIANIFTTVLDGDQDAETVAWNRYDSPDYERGFVTIAGRTARMIRSRDNASLPYVTTEYDIPLSGNRILSILIPVYEDGTLEDVQKLFLETLEIRDSLYAEPPAGSNNTSTGETNIPDYQEESTATPTTEPTATPMAEPTATPTVEPTATPTAEPTATPTPEPTATPTPEPTVTPTPIPEPIVTPEPVPAPDYSGWLGTWRAAGSGHESTMIIMENGSGGLNMFVTLDNRITISSALEPVENGMMDFDNGDVNGLLTMDQEHVLWMTDVGSFLDDVNNWMDNFGFVVEYHVPGESTRPQQGGTVPNDTAPAENPAPVQSTIALIPVAGRSDVMQVPVMYADATSWIEGKDPSAYTPYRMIDGEEKTAFQVSTKTTKLGEIYLYFNFREPVAIDELWIKNGFWKKTDGLDQYTRNSRIKGMTVDFCHENEGDYRDGQKVTLKDDKKRKDWQVVELGRKTNVTSVRICVKSIYQGTKYKTDVCVSEVMFIQKPGN